MKFYRRHKLLSIVTVVLIATFLFSACDPGYGGKPVIYLYPTETTEVSVLIEHRGVIDYTYPPYNESWSVIAHPDGKIINKADNKEYSYLFWEGHGARPYDFSEGFVVKGCDTTEFLQEKLAFMGLTPKEYNEFIVYWDPQLQDNKYNLISFQGEQYTEDVKLIIDPEPDSILRVFMAVKPLNKAIDVPEQKLSSFDRTGFTVVEWGGSIID